MKRSSPGPSGFTASAASRPATNSPVDPSYGLVAVFFHWVLAAAILMALGLGLYMHGLPFSPTRLRLFNWHKWLGIAILILSAARLLWRLSSPPPPLPDAIALAMPRWQRRSHALAHTLFYVLFFGVPMSGWAYSSAAGFPIVWLGVLPLPDWLPVNKELAESVLKPLHQALAFSLAGLVVAHAGAVVKHQIIDRDGLFWRMWPRKGEAPRPGTR